MHLQHGSMLFLPAASRVTTFWLGHAQKSKFWEKVTYVFRLFRFWIFSLSFFSFSYLFVAVIDLLLGLLALKKTSKEALSRRGICILIPRGRALFGQYQKPRPLARSNDIPDLNGFVNTIDQNQSDLSDLTLSMRRVTGSPWITDFRCWTWPEVTIFGADQKESGLWGRECVT